MTSDNGRSQGEGRLALVGDLIAQVRSLPPLPSGVVRLLALNPRDPALVESVVRIIEADPALATQLLRLANSAAFTGQTIVDTVERAVLRVGVKMITGTVAQSQLQNVFDPADPILGALWVANVYSANLAMNLAAAAPAAGVPVETAYSYGLIHDVGRLVTALTVGAAFEELLAEAPALRTDLVRRERALFGFDHAAAGRLLGNRWGLPTDMRLVVSGHHKPREALAAFPEHVARVIDLLAVVDEITHVMLVRGERVEEVVETLKHEFGTPDGIALLAPLQIGPDEAVATIEPAAQAVEKQRQLLGLKKPEAETPSR